MDDAEGRPESVGVCAFHVVDKVGEFVDSLFAEAAAYDDLLRSLRGFFAYGGGRLISRAFAQKFCNLAEYFDEQGRNARERQRDAEGKRQPLAASNHSQAAEKHIAEARALRKAGWCRWKVPLAPKKDGTRKVVWQTTARARLFETFGVMYWSIRGKQVECLENAHHKVRAQGKQPTVRTGARTKDMANLRSLGRTLLDLRLIVFNMIRADFRAKFLVRYAKEVQATLTFGKSASAYEISGAMFAAIGALVEARGIILMVKQLASAHTWVVTNPRKDVARTPVRITSTTLWCTLKTLLMHRAWRCFPLLAVNATEILLGGTFRGVPLDGEVFRDPDDHIADTSTRGEMQARNRTLREGRFDDVLFAIDRAMAFAQVERHRFMQKVLGVATTVAGRKVHNCAGLPRADLLVAEPGDIAEDDDSADGGYEEPERMCFMPRPARASQAPSDGWSASALLSMQPSVGFDRAVKRATAINVGGEDDLIASVLATAHAAGVAKTAVEEVDSAASEAEAELPLSAAFCHGARGQCGAMDPLHDPSALYALPQVCFIIRKGCVGETLHRHTREIYERRRGFSYQQNVAKSEVLASRR